jgi:hypothetical protein
MRNTELQRIKESQRKSLIDTCTIDQYKEGTDSYGSIIPSWVSGSPISCGFTANLGSKSYGTDFTTKQTYLAVFRISDETVITAKDKITLTGISGSAVLPIQYQVVSIEQGRGLFLIGCEGVEK